MPTIPIQSKGNTFYCHVDDDDYEKLKAYRWYLTGDGYVARLALMHREVMGVSEGTLIVDHQNHDKTDNRKSNLRVCTKAQNVHNQKKRRTGRKLSSKFKGVHRHKSPSGDSWRVVAMEGGQKFEIGRFDDEEEAAMAYDRAAWSLYGEFAVTNFPEGHGGQRKDLDDLVERQLCRKSGRSPNRKGASQFKGVGFFKNNQKWTASIQHHKKRRFLGYFETEEEAARAYDSEAKKLHGDSAFLNFQ